ncbi:thioredoxin family protein [Hymenobacter sp. HMF4947]|uniref:Thioredoxin family protein n=1 Tax=Hymenobacter ginkgonis TaxID=2682976 RepID=A0A7K1TEQ9_9BACT|nr:thioredoxin family protein [Hymenobacter ginkgonis]MVN76893.1 thioredoxin family protein [Hymenobacter ginkgonis]
MRPAPTPVLSPERLASAYTYPAYRQLIDDLLLLDKTTGLTQSAELLHFARLNVQRMSRLDKTVYVLPELADAVRQLPEHFIWLVITEGWCGDAAQIVPVLEAVAQASQGQVQTRYLLRDENPDLMARYLTNGAQAIPQVIVLHAATLAEAAHWGPRPAPAQALVQQLKAEGMAHDDFITALHTWYAHDKTQTTQHELLALVQHLR